MLRRYNANCPLLDFPAARDARDFSTGWIQPDSVRTAFPCQYPPLCIDPISGPSNCVLELAPNRCWPDTDAKGVIHTIPGQRPGLVGQKMMESAESAFHNGEAGRWPASISYGTRTQGVALGWYEAGRWPERVAE
jgi:hypothetical protein